MPKYIHVTTTTKLPKELNGRTAYRDLDPVLNNVNGINTPFGEHAATMFLLVVSPAPPAFDPLTEAIQSTFTVGADGKTYRGAYVAPNWVEGFNIVPKALEDARSDRLTQLDADYQAAIEAGYTVPASNPPVVLGFDDEFYQKLASHLTMVNNGVSAGLITTSTVIHFSDIADRDVSPTVAQVRSTLGNYAQARFVNYHKYVIAKGQLVAATTLSGINSVVWSF